MKKTILFTTAVTAMFFIACNSNSSTKDNNTGMNQDSITMQQNTQPDKDIKMVAATFTSVDPAVAAYIKTLVTDYLSIKNALVNSNGTAAA